MTPVKTRYPARWAQETRAATAIEYGLIVSAISFAVIVAVFLLGGSLNDIFVFVGNKMTDILGKI